MSSRERTRTFLRDLRVALEDGGGFARPAPGERAAEEERGGEPVSSDVLTQVEHVTGLLAAEDAAFTAQSLEHVAVTDGRRHRADAALRHEPVEAEVRHHGDGHEVDVESQREDREDGVAVERLPPLVDGEQAVAVPVERDPQVETALDHLLAQSRKVGRAAADVDVRAVGLHPDGVHFGAEAREGARRDLGRAPFAQSTPIRRPLRSEPKCSSTWSR